MENEELRMTFTEHLGELRTRLIRAGIALIVGFLVCYAFSDTLFQVISKPLRPLEEAGIVTDVGVVADLENGVEGAENGQPNQQPANAQQRRTGEWTALSPLEPFLVRLKLAAYGGILVALPFLIYQACAFIFPGLRPNEQQAIRLLLAGCSVLAIAGVAVAYSIIFPLVLPYLVAWAPEGVNIQFRMNETVSIILKGLMGFAVAFQFPMAVLILVYMGLLSAETLRRYRKIAIVLIAVGSAFLTPPEPISMFIMMLPLALLYEVSIWLSYLVKRRTEPADDGTAG